MIFSKHFGLIHLAGLRVLKLFFLKNQFSFISLHLSSFSLSSSLCFFIFSLVSSFSSCLSFSQPSLPFSCLLSFLSSFIFYHLSLVSCLFSLISLLFSSLPFSCLVFHLLSSLRILVLSRLLLSCLVLSSLVFSSLVSPLPSCLSLSLSLSLSVSVSISEWWCGRVVVLCCVLCCVLSCGVCAVWCVVWCVLCGTLKTPCVHSKRRPVCTFKRPRVYRHHAHDVETHVRVVPVHTGKFSIDTRGFSIDTPPQHTQHTEHTIHDSLPNFAHIGLSRDPEVHQK